MGKKATAKQTKKMTENPTSFLPGANTESAALLLRDQFGKFAEGNRGTLKRFKSKEEIIQCGIDWLTQLDGKPPAMAGLALALGFKSRRSLCNYASEPGYEFAYDAIQFLKLKIEEHHEQRLLDPKNHNVAGLIFNLKNNFDWADKTELKVDQRTLTFNGFDIDLGDEQTTIPINED